MARDVTEMSCLAEAGADSAVNRRMIALSAYPVGRSHLVQQLEDRVLLVAYLLQLPSQMFHSIPTKLTSCEPRNSRLPCFRDYGPMAYSFTNTRPY